MMAKHFFTGGHAGSTDRVVCFASTFPDEGQATTRTFFLNVKNATPWETTAWPNGAVASCDFDHGPGNRLALCILSDQGLVSISNRNEILAELIPEAGLIEPSSKGYMSSILAIGKQLFACGDNAQLYERIGPNQWRSVIPDVAAYAQEQSNSFWGDIVSGRVGLSEGTNALRGRKDFATLARGADGKVLIGGGFGLVAQVDHGDYQEARVDERSQIVNVTQRGGEITAVGWHDSATRVFRGTFDSGFSQVLMSRAAGNASSAAYFGDDLYVGSKLGLFKFKSGRLEHVSPSLIKGVSKLAPIGDVLWVIGHYDIYRLSENGWEHFPQPD